MSMLDILFTNKNKKDTTDNVDIEEVISKNWMKNGIISLKCLDNVESSMTILNSMILLVIFFIMILVSHELKYIW